MTITTREYTPLDDKRAELLLLLVVAEQSGGFKKRTEAWPFLSEVVKRRIGVFELPIQFTDEALMAVNLFCDRPGAAIILLIDCLEHVEGGTVTVTKLCEIYPTGFYSEKSLGQYIDDLKRGKGKWAYIY